MKQSDEHDIRDEAIADGAPEAPGQSKRARKGSARPSMRRELLELFRDTRPVTPAAMPPAEAAASEPGSLPARTATRAESAPAGSTPEPSRFLRRYLQQTAPDPEPAHSGLPFVDACLGGGFGPGLHLVVGSTVAVSTAFLEAVAWEAVGSRRPVLYYPFRSGGLPVWERLVATLGAMFDGPGLDPAALRGRELSPSDVETLARLDSTLQATVFPYLSLIDGPDDGGGDLSAFVAGLRSHAWETAERLGRPPVVLMDGLDALLAVTGLLPPLQVLSRLDEALAGDSLPCLLAADPAGYLEDEQDGLPVRTMMRLETWSQEPAAGGGRVDLEIRKNLATGWTGVMPLLLDPLSGLFAEAQATQ